MKKTIDNRRSRKKWDLVDDKLLVNAVKAVLQLGLTQTGLYALYRLGLWSGHYRRATPGKHQPLDLVFQPLFKLPDPQELSALLGQAGLQELRAQAEEIASGRVRLFGGEAVSLTFPKSDTQLKHWTAYEQDASLYAPFYGEVPDVKFTWEPARFGWAFTLGRAWHMLKDERYPRAFWEFTEAFLQANPPCQGPQWVSAQEVAIRLMALCWAGQVFADSTHSTTERRQRLAAAIAEHAERIPPTLVYARSQNNNHLLSEAAGLFSAGLALPEHPAAVKWRTLGWKWFVRGVYKQVDAWGESSQHSTNYQRLLLQLALWVKPLASRQGLGLPRKVSESLSLATHWLLSMLDPLSGGVPNLGANDGAYFFPLTNCPYGDFRPVLQAAARSFLGYQLSDGAWDELASWCEQPASVEHMLVERYPGDALSGKESWASLRAARLKNRPGHADQLHLDLWWHGLNIARDPGTYLYNAPPPWDNALTNTRLHNTVSVDGWEQMRRAGRFLYLDWAQAGVRQLIETDESILQRSLAWQNGYRHLGVHHERTVTVFVDDRWQVEDRLLNRRSGRPAHTYRLQWCLPDWEWELKPTEAGHLLRLLSPHGWVQLQIDCDQPGVEACLARAGERLLGGSPVQAIDGWFSATYGQKQPALSLACAVTSQFDVKFSSYFIFPVIS